MTTIKMKKVSFIVCLSMLNILTSSLPYDAFSYLCQKYLFHDKVTEAVTYCDYLDGKPTCCKSITAQEALASQPSLIQCIFSTEGQNAIITCDFKPPKDAILYLMLIFMEHRELLPGFDLDCNRYASRLRRVSCWCFKYNMTLYSDLLCHDVVLTDRLYECDEVSLDVSVLKSFTKIEILKLKNFKLIRHFPVEIGTLLPNIRMIEIVQMSSSHMFHGHGSVFFHHMYCLVLVGFKLDALPSYC